MTTQTDLILTGRSKEHLILLKDENKWIHKDAEKDYLALKKVALGRGFTVKLASAFRDFETQLRIWNEKASGKRKLLARDESEIKRENLSAKELVYSILIWSQIPGASRHHWGTDIDVFDETSCPPGYSVQLTRKEVEKGGYFFQLHEWLDKNLQSFHFYRPYATDRGGIQPERWHLSFFPVAEKYQKLYSFELLRKTIEESPILLKETLLSELPNIYQNYVTNIDSLTIS